MLNTTLTINDETNCNFSNLSVEVRRNLFNKNKIFNPQNRFVTSCRLGRWDGKHPYFMMNGDTYINILEPIIDYLISCNYDIKINDIRKYNRDFEFDLIDNQSFSNTCWPEYHALAGQPIILRDHQVEAINMFLQNFQGIERLPTGAGKTLIVSILSKKIEKYGRSIVIVPNKDLIAQTEEYYKILGLDVGVYYGDRKEFFKKHTICTWQSLEKLRQSPVELQNGEEVNLKIFIDNVVAIIVDEVHGCKAEVLSNLLTKEFGHIPIRWGLTGTIPKEQHEIINLTIGIGQIIHNLETSELQELNILSDCNVNIMQLIDTKEFSDYHAEYEYLVDDERRIEYISDIIRKTSETGNVLVLVGRKDTGKKLEKLINGSVFLSGATKSNVRKQHYNEVAVSNSKVIIATSGIAAVGIDVPRLNHLFLIEPGKSFIRTIQSIGRVLRTSFDKNHAQIWDICSTCRFSKRHLTNRKKYYTEQKFPFTISKITWQ